MTKYKLKESSSEYFEYSVHGEENIRGYRMEDGNFFLAQFKGAKEKCFYVSIEMWESSELDKERILDLFRKDAFYG